MLKLLAALLILLNFTAWLWWSAQAAAPRQVLEHRQATPEQAKSLMLVSEVAKDSLIYKKRVLVVTDNPAELSIEAGERLTPLMVKTLVFSEPRVETMLEPELMRADQSEALADAEIQFSDSPPNPGAKCMTLGPFQEAALADKAEHELRELQLHAERVANEMQENSRYWVLLSPGTDQSEAENMRNNLKEQGIEFFVVGSGEYAGYLSTGFFESQDNAQKRLEGLGSLREEAFIREISTHKTEYWLKAKPESPQEAAKLVQFQRSNPAIRLFGCAELADTQ